MGWPMAGQRCHAVGRQVTTRSDPAKDTPLEALRRAVVVALRVTKETQLPRKHAFHEYYSPMLCVLHARALDVDAAARVRRLSVHTIEVLCVCRRALGGDKPTHTM